MYEDTDGFYDSKASFFSAFMKVTTYSIVGTFVFLIALALIFT